MKQEQKLVAETYRYLAPFIDTSRDIYLSLDGQAALVGVGRGHFVDGTIPDLWFTLLGHSEPILIEAKSLDPNGRVLLLQSQLVSWRSGRPGAHKPHYWIAASNAFDRFFFWRHSDFLPGLDLCKSVQDTVTLSAPASKSVFPTINQLVLHILREPMATASPTASTAGSERSNHPTGENATSPR
jgi:hypothetical protein